MEGGGRKRNQGW